jgi:uncharacterized tellurite resistance protein B-like protein
MVLRRMFGNNASADPADPAPVGSLDPETAALRHIVSQLDALPPGERHFIAGFAYVLSRVANANLEITPEEVAEMEKIVLEVGGLQEAQAVLVVQIARNQAQLYGGTDDYLITREFARTASPEQRDRLLRCCFAVGAADGSIDAWESAELDQVGRELAFTDREVRAVRAEFRESFAAVQGIRRLPGSTSAAPAPAGADAPGGGPEPGGTSG